MANTQTEILNRLIVLNKALANGSLSRIEMTEMVQLTRELHEKTLIISYKALEQNVYGKATEKTEEKPIETESLEELHSNTKEKNEVEDLDFSNTEIENPEIDFSIFDTETTKNIEKKENTSNPTTRKKESIETTSETSILKQIDEEKHTSFYERFSKPENDSLLGKMSSRKLDSLKGAFGLNEKLQVVNELFDGNSELFNKAIDILDNQDSEEDAREQLSKIAVSNDWNLEKEIVEEFVKKVERRYV